MSGRPIVFVYPRGTCKATPFYFRGDDVLKETEYIRKERKDLKEKLEKAEQELKKEKENFNKANEELGRCDNFTVNLASALGNGSENTAKCSQLRHELADLTTKIEGTDRAIVKYKKQKNPSLIRNYQKEISFYETELEELNISILDGINSISEGKEDLARLVCSEEFATSNIAKGLYKAKKNYYNHLRKEINEKKNYLNEKQSGSLLKTSIPQLSVEIERLIYDKQNYISQKSAIDHELYNKKEVMHKTSFALIDLIGKMNEVLVALGGEKYDVDALKEKYTNLFSQKEGAENKEDPVLDGTTNSQRVDTTEEDMNLKKPRKTSQEEEKKENKQEEEFNEFSDQELEADKSKKSPTVEESDKSKKDEKDSKLFESDTINME